MKAIRRMMLKKLGKPFALLRRRCRDRCSPAVLRPHSARPPNVDRAEQADPHRRPRRGRGHLPAPGRRDHGHRQRRIPPARGSRLARGGPSRRCGSRTRVLPPGLTQQQALEQSLLRIQSVVAQGRGDEAWRQVSSMQAPTAQPRRRVITKPASRSRSPRAPARRHPRRAIARTGHRPGRCRSPAPGVVSPVARRRRARCFARPAAGQRRDGARLARGRGRRGRQLAQSHAGCHAARGLPQSLPVAPGARGAVRRTRCRRREPPAELEAAPHLALILPLTGPHLGPAAQIRDGFMTAYYQFPPNARPRLRVYDRPSASIADTMAEAPRPAPNSSSVR